MSLISQSKHVGVGDVPSACPRSRNKCCAVYAGRIIKGGIQCLRLCNKNGGIANTVDLFTEVFRLMHPKDFVELMSSRMDYLFENLLAEPELMSFVALLLDKKVDQGVDKKLISIHFMEILGSYLVGAQTSLSWQTRVQGTLCMSSHIDLSCLLF